MADWASWSLAGEELALVRYVRPREVARHVRLPGRSGESRLARLRGVYSALAAKQIGYAFPAPGAEAGMQVIRMARDPQVPLTDVGWVMGQCR